MKRFIFFALVYLFCSTILPVAISAQDSTVVYPNYVVIGAFAIHENAVEFNGEAKKNALPAEFQINPNRNLYYVYVLTTDDRSSAFEEATKLRRDTKYFDTWVYSGPLGNNRGQIVYHPGASQDFNPETGAALDAVNVTQTNENTIEASPGPSTTIHRDTPADKNAKEGRNKEKETTSRKALDTRSTPVTAQADNSIQPTSGLSAEKSTENAKPAALVPTGRKDSPRGQVAADGSQLSGQQNIDNTERPSTQKSPATNQGVENGIARNESPPRGKTTPQQNEKSTPLTSTNTPENKTHLMARDNAAPGEGAKVVEHVPDIDTNGLTETGKKAIAENIEKVATLGPPPVRATTQPLTKEEVAGKDFYFYLFRGDNLTTVDGEVDAIDFEKARRMATYQANAPVKVIMPSGNSKRISFVCQVFGYRKQQREYDPASPPDDVYLDKKGNLVVPFELSRLQKGDIAIMYNVFFFKDAAVMRPESRFEVTNLLELLVENPTYKIMIHGHTNGNATGKIIRMDTPGNFYTLSGTKQGFGSAKQLSEERANVIREFLIASGISPDRMDIRAWGGKKPIHDKHSVRANENVRVEIEILSQ